MIFGFGVSKLFDGEEIPWFKLKLTINETYLDTTLVDLTYCQQERIKEILRESTEAIKRVLES